MIEMARAHLLHLVSLHHLDWRSESWAYFWYFKVVENRCGHKQDILTQSVINYILGIEVDPFHLN